MIDILMQCDMAETGISYTYYTRSTFALSHIGGYVGIDPGT